jgi:hypothetical protein
MPARFTLTIETDAFDDAATAAQAGDQQGREDAIKTALLLDGQMLNGTYGTRLVSIRELDAPAEVVGLGEGRTT